jgi:FkbM family methyltransferase
MLNLNHLRDMGLSAKALGLSPGDTVRWLWSYYASRLPGARSRADSRVHVTLGNGVGKGLRLTIRANGWDFRILEEIFAEDEYSVNLDNVHRVLDLGGNIGLAALFFARRYPSALVCTVEPIPDNLVLLEHNLELNPSHVEVVRAGIGTQDGKACFKISEFTAGHSREGINMSVLPTGERIEVDMLSVPSLMQRIGWRDIDMLKIDIEGSEAEVLGGRPDWLNQVRCIIGEGHFGVGYTIEVCRRDLEPMGFAVEELRKNEYSMAFLARRRG